MDLRKLPPVDLMSLFEVSLPIAKGKPSSFARALKSPYLIPSVADFLGEDSFFQLGLSWTEEAFYLYFKIDVPFQGAYFPEFERGDAIEVFIDTRGIVSATSIHKYCHHFVFLPKEVDGIQAVEVTRFKNQDRHPPASHENFVIDTKIKKHEIEMEIMIPEISLFGYTPTQVPKLGFACRVHRSKEESGHFPLSGKDFKIETSPAIWARLDLIEG